jgi:hypothetical protein
MVSCIGFIKLPSLVNLPSNMLYLGSSRLIIFLTLLRLSSWFFQMVLFPLVGSHRQTMDILKVTKRIVTMVGSTSVI